METWTPRAGASPLKFSFAGLILISQLAQYSFLHILEKIAKEINSFKIYRACFGITCLPSFFGSSPWPPSSETWWHSQHDAKCRGLPVTLEAVSCVWSEMTLCDVYFPGSLPCRDIRTEKNVSWYPWEILNEQVAKTLSPKSCQPLEKWSPASPFNQISPYQTATKFFKGQRLKCHSQQTFWKQGFQKRRKRRNTYLMVIGQSHHLQLHCCRCPLCQVAYFFLE